MAGETVDGQGHECRFRQHGISVKCKSKTLDDIRITSRCIRYEQNSSDFGLLDDENFCSKIYLFRVENSDDTFRVKVTLPVYKGPSENETIIMKTDDNTELKVSKTKRSKNQGWCSTFRCKLHGEISLVAVCRPNRSSFVLEDVAVPKTEQEPCDSGDGHQSTEVLQSPLKSPSLTGTQSEYDVVFLVMSILPEMESDQCDILVDCSEVFKAGISRAFWEKKGYRSVLQSVVNRTVPKQTFRISVQSRDSPGDIGTDVKPLTLQFHPLRPNFVKLKLHCTENALNGILNDLQIRKVYQDASDNAVLEKTTVVLFAFSEKHCEEELEKEEKLEEKKEVLEKEDTFGKEEATDENERVLEEKKDVLDKADILEQEQVSEKENVLETKGVLEKEDVLEKKDELEKNEIKNKELEKENSEQEEKLSTSEVKSDEKDVQMKDIIQREFLNNDLLSALEDKFEDSWFDILILLGTPFNVIEKEMLAISNGDELKGTRLKIVQQWRDGNSHHADKGIPQLLCAFLKCGRIDCCHFMRFALKEWRSQAFSVGDALFLWSERAYADPDLFTPAGYPRPMSDQYLVLLCAGLTPTVDLATALNISAEEYERIAENPSYAVNSMKLMKLFTIFRDRAKTLEDALGGLLDALKMIKSDDQWSRGIACASGWLNRNSDDKDELRVAVKNCLDRKDSVPSKSFSRRWSHVRRSLMGLQFSRQKSVKASTHFTSSASISRSQVHQGFFG